MGIKKERTSKNLLAGEGDEGMKDHAGPSFQDKLDAKMKRYRFFRAFVSSRAVPLDLASELRRS